MFFGGASDAPVGLLDQSAIGGPVDDPHGRARLPSSSQSTMCSTGAQSSVNGRVPAADDGVPEAAGELLRHGLHGAGVGRRGQLEVEGAVRGDHDVVGASRGSRRR